MSDTARHQDTGARPGQPSPGGGDANQRTYGKVVFVAVTAPDYMQRPLELVVDRLGGGFRLLAGDSSFEPSVRTRVDLGSSKTRVHNRFLLGNRLLWQSGSNVAAIRADVTILVLNPRVLSTWFVVLVRRLLRRPTVLRGHAWSRRGPRSRTERVRHLLRKRADVLVTYTEAEGDLLRAKMPAARIVVAPNALYSRAEIRAASAASAPTDFIYVGRLVPAKKPRLLVEAFLSKRDELPPQTRLVIVGEGDERADLEALVRREGAAERVRFEGHVSAPDALRGLYAHAVASVSPGYVGLSLIQSLAFGVPMIVSRDEPHSPEIEAAIEGETTVAFETDSVHDLGRALVAMARERERWAERREALAAFCAEWYSADVMADRIVEAVALAHAGARRAAARR
jgi:glycosyltransferase involved in cell wall biosynthesis